jgi:GT2 family glycosyltransferase
MNAEITVVVPTFQRAGWLRETLGGLVRQTLSVDRFEVVVTDDGSADGTVDVVRSFADRLNLRYVYHHDLGHRVAATRNAGARAAAAPVLAFVDAGTRPSAGCVEAHLRAHMAAELTGSMTVVVGRVAGYDNRTATENPDPTSAGLPSAEPAGDMRDEELDRFSRTLENTCLPWRLAWTANLSVDAETFASVGGFDERFTGWGAEDMELAYRLHRFGARFRWSDEACAVECPHPRDMTSNIESNRRNQQLFYELHPEPEIEVFIAARRTGQDVHDSIAEYRSWAAAAAAAARATAARAAAESSGTVPLQAKKALFGPSVRGSAEVVINPFGDPAVGAQSATVHPAVGLHTRLPDDCFESAVVQAAHYGPLWKRWADEIVREARRIARDVTVEAA